MLTVLLTLDRAINVLLGGIWRETLSSRADRMEIARLRDEVRKQKPQLAALMEVMEAELPADKG